MKKTYKLGVIICLVLAVVLSIGAMFILQDNGATAEQIKLDCAEIKSVYNLNEKVSFPKQVTVNLGGEKTATNGIVEFPNGSVYSVDNGELTLSNEGRYTVKYFFENAGARVTAVANFEVYSALYSLTASNGSSVTAVTSEMNQVEMKNTQIDSMRDGKEGLIVRLYEGCKFVYNKPVNLNDRDEEGLASVLTFHPRNSTQKTIIREDNHQEQFVNDQLVAAYTYVRLTDCYDSRIFVELVLDNKSGGMNLICYRAGSNSQEAAGIYLPDLTGSVSYKTKEVFYDGVRGIARFFDWGPYNFAYRNVLKSEGVTVKYDNENNRIYVENGKDRLMVNDLSNTDIYDENLFYGFTTGEVYVSVFNSEYYSANSTRIDITSVGKDSGEALLSGMEGKVENLPVYRDDVVPKIKINVEKTDNYGIYAAVGDKIKIPSATVFDVNESEDLCVNVYRNYQTENKIRVDIVNGYFTVAENDIYYIEYKAIDKYGNSSIEVLKVFANVNAEKGLKFEVGKLAGLLAGKETTLLKPQISTVNDKAKLRLQVKVSLEGGEEQVIVEAVGLEAINGLAQTQFNYTPLYSGNYTVTYVCYDNVNSTTFSYQVACESSDAIVFLKKPYLSRNLLKGATYLVEDTSAYSFSTGKPVEQPATVYVAFDGGEFTKVNDPKQLKITGNSTAQIKLECAGAQPVYSDVANIVDVAFGSALKLDKYFVGDGFEVDENAAGLVYKSTVNSGDNRLQFANVISAKTFVFDFMLNTETSNFEKLNLILTDPYAKENKVVITYGNNGGKAYCSINNGITTNLNFNFADDAQSRRIFYEAKDRKMVIGGVSLDYVFPFTTSACYLDVEMIGINGASAIEIKSVNNQNFNKTLRFDMNQPEIAVYKSEGYYKVGEIINVYAPQFIDVLSPIDYSSIKVTVTRDGQYVTSVDGVVLDGVNNDPLKDYQIQAQEYGDYRVVYVANDTLSADNQASVSYIFSIIDDVPPTITLEEGYTEDTVVEVVAGTTFKINYKTSDNSQFEPTTYVILTNKSTRVNRVYTNGEIFMTELGEFEVSIVCVDQMGNMATAKFSIVCKMGAK